MYVYKVAEMWEQLVQSSSGRWLLAGTVLAVLGTACLFISGVLGAGESATARRDADVKISSAGQVAAKANERAGSLELEAAPLREKAAELEVEALRLKEQLAHTTALVTGRHVSKAQQEILDQDLRQVRVRVGICFQDDPESFQYAALLVIALRKAGQEVTLLQGERDCPRITTFGAAALRLTLYAPGTNQETVSQDPVFKALAAADLVGGHEWLTGPEFANSYRLTVPRRGPPAPEAP